jgi:hypothetical protein
MTVGMQVVMAVTEGVPTGATVGTPVLMEGTTEETPEETAPLEAGAVQTGDSEEEEPTLGTAGALLVGTAGTLVVWAEVPVASALERPGQSVTVGAQEVMVTSSVS